MDRMKEITTLVRGVEIVPQRLVPQIDTAVYRIGGHFLDKAE